MLVERGRSCFQHEELVRTAMNLLQDNAARTTAGARASAFVQANLGATQRILRFIEPYITRIENGRSS
jgi:3-deoxy-D-manno-octulosonic-acid transferase